MIVKDDNVEGIGELRQRIIFKDLNVNTGGKKLDRLFLNTPGKFTRAIKYMLTTGSNQTAIKRPASEQTWYREIIVEPVDECTDTTIDKRWQHKCHKYAVCKDTYVSYECECRQGFQCEDCDGFKSGFGLLPKGPGCRDETAPTITLSGPWPAYSESCACGSTGDALVPQSPTPAFMKEHGLTATATDHGFDEDFNVVIVPFNDIKRHEPERVKCADIPLVNPPGTTKHGDNVRCDDKNSIVWRVTYSAVDESGNKAKPLSHFVIKQKTQVLQRLLELEAFVEKVKSNQTTVFASMSDQIASALASATFMGMDLQQTGLVLLLILATCAFYFGWIPTVIKMFGALFSPHTMRRHDFEEGFDLWLRLSSFGFKGSLKRNREIEQAWASLEDEA